MPNSTPTSPPTSRIDPITLRDIPDDVAAARAYLAELETRGEHGDAERVPWLRMLGHLEEAESLGRAILDRAGGTDVQGGVGPALRLAHVLHWQGRFREADTLFDAARATAAGELEDANNERSRRWAAAMLAFADQHQGKARFDEGRTAEALALFERALARRIAENAPEDQINSTRQALAAAKARAAETNQP